MAVCTHSILKSEKKLDYEIETALALHRLQYFDWYDALKSEKKLDYEIETFSNVMSSATIAVSELEIREETRLRDWNRTPLGIPFY